MFDGVHVGHRSLVAHLLRLADERGLEPLVVTFDRHPRQVLHPGDAPALLTTTEERLSLLEASGVRTVVMVPFDEATASLSACHFASRFLVERLRMKLLLLGYDNQFGSRTNNDFDRLETLAAEQDFELLRDEAVYRGDTAVSSTQIRKALMAGDMERANAMLGMPYTLIGKVVHGRQVGTSMGFPTANVVLDDAQKLLPATGVYAMLVELEGRRYVAMGNLGAQPTFGLQQWTLEVHLLAFSGDLYGKMLKVAFVKRMRDIRSFASPDLLVAQLKSDREQVSKIVVL